MANFTNRGDRAWFTVMQPADQVSDGDFNAVQNVTVVAVASTPPAAGCPAAVPVLRIERLDSDRTSRRWNWPSTIDLTAPPTASTCGSLSITPVLVRR